jgi:hypothetical protein
VIPPHVQETGSVCAHCDERPGTELWGDALALTHGGGQSWCKVCVLEEQVKHARERAAALPGLEDELREARGDLPTMALRPDHRFPDEMDDIVVNDVKMFRAEAMDDDAWWMACYFANGEEVRFWVGIGKNPKRIVVSVTDKPAQWIDWDKRDAS